MKNKKLKLLSLFTGAGGMDLGFKQAGFDIVWANDSDVDSTNTYRRNVGNHIVLGNISTFKCSEMPNDIDVVIGGFPCQGFSVANNKRTMKDKRNFLYKELIRVIKNKKPKFFVAENVKGLTTMKKGAVIKMIINDFKSLGYDVDYRLLAAADYGVPQNRERVFIVGNRLGLKNPFPKVTHGPGNDAQEQLTLFNHTLKPHLTAEDVVGHLANVRTRDKPFKLNGKIIFNHVARTNVADTFWGRKHNVNQHDICDI